ncbi:MAG: hypothetical protein J2O39_02540 [Acidimicrobiales bacterium]|nr:hypothetical protein [Acidimicrobiales bacterium]
MTTEQTRTTIERWFADRLPKGWFTEAPEVLVDSDEILVIGRLSPPPPLRASRSRSDPAGSAAREGGAEGERPGGGDDDQRRTAAAAVGAFREETRDERMAIAEEAEGTFGRRVSWGAACGDVRQLFTTLSVPVMTRLRLTERTVLDTLVESGVARSRSDALSWCVRLVGRHEADWLTELREALVNVRKVRSEGPRLI